jgi:hypothetical protein
MKQLLAVGLVGLVCAGCVESRAYRNMLASGGALSVDPTPGPGYDHTVAIKNAKDIGFDPNVKTERDAMALQVIAQQCPGAQVVKEDVVDMGQNVLGPSRNYYIRIRCRPA